MSEEMKNNELNNENQENKDQAPATEPKQETPAAEDKKSEKIGFGTKVKNFGKEKVIPAAKLVGKGVAKGASIAGGALATAYLIGMAIGGYTAVKGKNSTEESTDQANETSSSESATEDKPADPEKTDDVQVILTESNIQTTEE